MARRGRAAAALPAGGGGAAKKARMLSVQTRTANRIRETFGDLDLEARSIRVDPGTSRTLREQVAWEITEFDAGRPVPSGKLHNDQLRQKYASPDGLDKQLEIDCENKEAGTVSPELLKAMAVAVGGKPDRDELVAKILTSKTLTRREFTGILRVVITMRMQDHKKQLPQLMLVLDAFARTCLSLNPKDNLLTKHVLKTNVYVPLFCFAIVFWLRGDQGG